MKHAVLIVAAAAMLAPMSAQAQVIETPNGYLDAVSCLAYAELPQLENDAFDAAALKQVADRYRAPHYMTEYVRQRERDAERRVRSEGRAAGDSAEAVATLRASRDQACASFVAGGLVQASAPTAS